MRVAKDSVDVKMEIPDAVIRGSMESMLPQTNHFFTELKEKK